MNAKTVLFCVCFLLFCLMAKSAKTEKQVPVSVTPDGTKTQPAETQKEYIVKQGRDEVFARHGHSDISFHVGKIRTVLDIGGGDAYFKFKPGENIEFCRLPNTQEVTDPSLLEYKKESVGWQKKPFPAVHVSKGKKVVLRAGNKYAEIKPIEFKKDPKVPRSSVEYWQKDYTLDPGSMVYDWKSWEEKPLPSTKASRLWQSRL